MLPQSAGPPSPGVWYSTPLWVKPEWRLCATSRSGHREGTALERRELLMDQHDDDLVIGVRRLPVVRDRMDLTHGDPSTSGGGDGPGDAGGDGLNLPE